MTAAKVADASVLAAVAFSEPRFEEASGLLAGIDLYEPTLLRYELAQIALKKVRADRRQEQVLIEGLTRALSGIHWVEPDPLEVLRVALKTGLTAYDAAYMVVARDRGLPIVSFDQRMLAASLGL